MVSLDSIDINGPYEIFLTKELNEREENKFEK